MDVNVVKLNSANIKVSNLADESSDYVIECNVNLNDGKIISFDGGSVVKDGEVKATFSKHGNHQDGITFRGVVFEEKCTIMRAIEVFFADAEISIAKTTFSI